MKRNLFYIISSVLLIIAAVVFFTTSRNLKSQPKILGASINNFYSTKNIKIEPPPKRKDGIGDPMINANAAILIYKSNKYPLYSLNGNASVSIASITKVMTAVVALDIYKLDDVITVDDEAAKVIPSKIYLKTGEQIRFEDLLFGLLMNSGNDAAKAIARGRMPEDQFIALMNKKSKELNLNDTEFKDVAGLDDGGHSCARDVAILFAYALDNPTFQKTISTSEKDISSIDGMITHKLKNSDRLTTGEIPIDGIIGGKTGYTPDAGHTLVTAAQRDGRTLIAVVLKTDEDTPSASAKETKKLLSWGFDSFEF